MSIYVLSRIGVLGYDEYVGKVIRARNEFTARSIANEHTGDEGRIWENPDLVTCVLVNSVGESGVIMEAFNAG